MDSDTVWNVDYPRAAGKGIIKDEGTTFVSLTHKSP